MPSFLTPRLRASTVALSVMAAGLVVGSTSTGAHAAGVATWTGAVSTSWSDPANWGGVLPADGDDLVFPVGAVRSSVVHDESDVTAYGSLTVAAPGFTISGNPLALTGHVSATFSSGTSTSAANLSVGSGDVDVVTGGTLSITGAVSGAAGLALAGGGTLRLASTANTHTGITEVGPGVLQVDGSLQTPVVLAGGTLTGSGSLNGAGVTATSPSTMSAGTATGPGLLAYASTSGLTLPTSSTFHVDIDGRGVGTGFDRLQLSDGSALFNPNGATLDVDLGYLPAVNSSFQIVSQAYGGPITGRFNGLPQFGTFTSGPVTFSIGYFNSGVILTVTSVSTPTVSVADTSLRVGETAPVTITFPQAVTGFTNADLTVPGGTLSPVSSTDGGTTWTATFTPNLGVTNPSNTITLDNTGVQYAGNPGLGTVDSNNYAIDTQRPTAMVTVAPDSLGAGATAEVTIVWTEAVSGFTLADLTVQNGTVSGLSSPDGGITWTATLSPSSGVTATANHVTLDNTGVADAAGNSGAGTTESNTYDVDSQPPTATIDIADTSLRAGETSTVTITFSEAVTGFTAADLTVSNGVLGSPSSADGGITWTATLTPATGVTDPTNVVTLANYGVADLAGNVGTGTTDSVNYAVDTLRPTAALVVGDDDLRAGETSSVTVTFSEAVSGFTAADLTVGNGSLSGLSSADGGITWTAILTPAVEVTDPTNVVTLDKTGVADLAGNSGIGTTQSNSYAVSTARPTATIALGDARLRAGETASVTITFSEAVSGFTAADLTVGNGTVSGLSSADGGTTWTATLTPAAEVTDPTNRVTLDDTGVVNAAGNTGTGTTQSANYEVDTLRPTATVTVVDDDVRTGETSAVRITFSEVVIGLTTADLAVPHASLSGLSSTNGGTTWTATLTPAAGITAVGNRITLDNTGVTDLAGNTGAGATSSNPYAIDTVVPPVVPPVVTPAPPVVTTAPPTADTEGPVSTVRAPRRSSTRSWTVRYTASDASTGVSSVDLYVRVPGSEAYLKVATDSTDQDGVFVYDGARDGRYRFHTVATDGAGNREAAPTSSATTILDTTGPSIRWVGGDLDTLDPSDARPLALRYQVRESVRSTMRISRAGRVVRTFRTRSSSPGVVERLWLGHTQGGARVRPGRYRVVVRAWDAAGNRTSIVTHVRVR